MELKTHNSGNTSSQLLIADSLLQEPMNMAALHQVIVSYLSNGRIDTSSQKNRSDVRGGGKKPWRQKGTGRARAGTIRSPIFRGGGHIFAGDSSKNYKKKVNRKLYAKVVRIIFSELVRQDRLLIVEKVDISRPKTIDFINWMNQYNVDNAVIVMNDLNESVLYAARNVKNVHLMTVSSMNLPHLIGHEKVIITQDALKKVEELFQ